jgi:hypothetical protein
VSWGHSAPRAASRVQGLQSARHRGDSNPLLHLEAQGAPKAQLCGLPALLYRAPEGIPPNQRVPRGQGLLASLLERPKPLSCYPAAQDSDGVRLRAVVLEAEQV